MSDSRLINRPASSLEEMQARASLKKDPRYRTGTDLILAGEEITAPAFTQERSFAKVIGSTLTGLARAEALREQGQSLPQNELKARLETDSGTFAEVIGKGSVVRETT